MQERHNKSLGKVVGPNSEIHWNTMKYLYRWRHAVKIWASPTLRWVGRQHAASNQNLQCRYQACLCKVWAAFEALMCCFVDGCVSHSQTNQNHAGRTLRHLLQWRLCSTGYGYTKSTWLWHIVNQPNGSTTGLLEEYCIKTPPWQNSQRCNSDLGSCSHDFRDGQESSRITVLLPGNCTSYFIPYNYPMFMQLEMFYIFDSQRSWTAFLTLRY